MVDLERYLEFLQESVSHAEKLEKLLQEDMEDTRLGMSGEAEQLYKEYCSRASDTIKDIRGRIMVLITESSAGLV